MYASFMIPDYVELNERTYRGAVIYTGLLPGFLAEGNVISYCHQTFIFL